MAGSNCTSRVTAKLGFKVTGSVAPDIVKPVPLNVPEAMVTGAVPVEVSVTGSVDTVFTVTLPNAKLAALMVSAGTVVVDAATFSCRVKLFEALPALAVSVAACALVTDDTVATNTALLALAGTAIVAGTLTAELLLVRPTLKPPPPAAELSVTVQASLPDPVIDALLQENATKVLVPAVPVPVGLTPAVLQPDSATRRQHVNIPDSSAHKPSSLRV